MTKPPSAATPTVNWLRDRGAFCEGLTWARQFPTLGECWAACERPDWMLWALCVADLRDNAKDRLFACWCVRNTPLPDGRKVWDLLTDPRSRNAVEVAERLAHGEASQRELDAALTDAWAVVHAVGNAARDATMAAAMAAAMAAKSNAASSAADAAGNAAWAAASSAADAESIAVWITESNAVWITVSSIATKAQADALRQIYDSPFEKDTPAPPPNTLRRQHERP